MLTWIRSFLNDEYFWEFTLLCYDIPMCLCSHSQNRDLTVRIICPSLSICIFVIIGAIIMKPVTFGIIYLGVSI